MTEPAAILATFSDVKLIKGRKVAQLIFEIPLEQAHSALNVLGMPQTEVDVWCGIAKLKSKPQTQLSTASTDGGAVRESADAPPSPKPNPHIKRFMALANDTGFWNFLRRKYGHVVKDAHDAEVLLKAMCEISSKTQLTDDSPATSYLRSLATEFNAWMRGQ